MLKRLEARRKAGRPKHDGVLTPREWEVVALLEDRLTNEQIAERLGISHSGAKYHVAEIISKLGVADRYEAVAWARRQSVRPSMFSLVPFFFMRLKPTALSVAVVAIIGVSIAATFFIFGRGSGGSQLATTGEVAAIADGLSDLDFIARIPALPQPVAGQVLHMRMTVINPFGEEPLERVQESWTEYGEGDTIRRRYAQQLDTSGKAFEVVTISDGWERRLDPGTGVVLSESFVGEVPLQSGSRDDRQSGETVGQGFSTHPIPIDPFQTYRDALAAGNAEVIALTDAEIVSRYRKRCLRNSQGRCCLLLGDSR